MTDDQRRFLPVGELDPVRQHALSYATAVVSSGNSDTLDTVQLARNFIAFLSPEDVLEPGQMPVILNGHRDIESLIQVVENALGSGRLSHHAEALANRLSEELAEHLATCGAHIANYED